MTDDIFRIAIVAGVGLACLAFIVQAGVAIALFRRIGKMHASAAPVLESAKPVIEKVGPMVERFTGCWKRPRGRPLEKAGAAADQLKSVANSAGKVLASANRVIDETRPQIVQLSGEMVEIAKVGRAQVERLGDLLFDASERAHERLDADRSFGGEHGPAGGRGERRGKARRHCGRCGKSTAWPPASRPRFPLW